MILIFGGTTEGKLVARQFDTLAIPYYYSTKTKVAFHGTGTPIHGAMTTEAIAKFCAAHQITHIINAAHPFAIQLHQTIANTKLHIPLIRYERALTPRIKHALVSYVDSFDEALALFYKKNYQSLLALSGVQTIAKLHTYWNNHPTWFRILDRDTSRQIAKKANFPMDHLLFGYLQSKEQEIKVYQQIAPAVIFTKESGKNGKLEEKIQAALTVNIPIIILKKPIISNQYLCIHTLEELTLVISS